MGPWGSRAHMGPWGPRGRHGARGVLGGTRVVVDATKQGKHKQYEKLLFKKNVQGLTTLPKNEILFGLYISPELVTPRFVTRKEAERRLLLRLIY